MGKKNVGKDFSSKVSNHARKIARVMVSKNMTTAHGPLKTNHGEGMVFVTVDPIVAEIVRRTVLISQKAVDDMAAIANAELESSAVGKAAKLVDVEVDDS